MDTAVTPHKGLTAVKPPELREGSALAGLRWGLTRDLQVALRSRQELCVQLLFYVIVVALFPLAVTPERNLLLTMGPGVLWVAALLASLLSLPRLFAADYADGTLEQMALSPHPLPALLAGFSAENGSTLSAYFAPSSSTQPKPSQAIACCGSNSVAF